MNEFREKLRSIGTLKHKGTTREHKVLDERNGRVAGKHVEHWDGRQDAVVTPETIKLKIGVDRGDKR